MLKSWTGEYHAACPIQCPKVQSFDEQSHPQHFSNYWSIFPFNVSFRRRLSYHCIPRDGSNVPDIDRNRERHLGDHDAAT